MDFLSPHCTNTEWGWSFLEMLPAWWCCSTPAVEHVFWKVISKEAGLPRFPHSSLSWLLSVGNVKMSNGIPTASKSCKKPAAAAFRIEPIF